jgi:hypothetical protein
VGLAERYNASANWESSFLVVAFTEEAMSFPPGSILKRRLHGLSGLFFYHMGVYVGGDTVIHFGPEKDWAGAIVRKESLAEFAAGRRVLLHAAPRNAAHGEAICAEAERLYTNAGNDFNHRYHFVRNNCEDFCVTTYEVRYA